MIDINELRVLEIYLPDDASKMFSAAIDRLEAAEKERDAAELMSLALRAKIEAMEKQEPVAVVEDDHNADGLSARISEHLPAGMMIYALPDAQNVPEKLCYDSRWEISIDYVDGWNAAIDAVRGKSPSWYCPDCCIVFPFGEPKSCPHDDARCNRVLTAAPEAEGK